ncbi:multiprotein-bridging factor 1 family protein [Lapidilactobacillus achengensis]|uniref:Multiprotein-bridging factor 1 family protein n=1 Tax=Lapidilactobacillus achengensis TaxID=2486000 RepID=A0ABW1UT23_9LACO|nr:helix-turn-helix domain-containing protein [Lapidilactobacillus achengensis]
MTIGTQIAAARQAKHWNQTKLAQEMSLAPDLIQAWESDQQLPNAQQLQELNQLLLLSLPSPQTVADPRPKTSHLSRFLLKFLLIGVPGIFLIAFLIPVIMLTAGDRYKLGSVSLVVSVSVIILGALIALLLRFRKPIHHFLIRRCKRQKPTD